MSRRDQCSGTTDADHVAAHSLRRVPLFGVQLTVTNYATTVRLLIDAALRRQSLCVSSLAVHGLMTAARDPVLREAVNAFDIVAADGHPVRWLMNRVHATALRERVAGTDLMMMLAAACTLHGVSIYLYGSKPVVVDDLCRQLHSRHPDLRIVGHEPSVFRPLTPVEDSALMQRIRDSGAGVVFLGLGCPLQEQFAAAHRTRIHAVQVCAGAAFEFLSGHKRRAPLWMRNNALEWTHRLCKEPRRLATRYVRTNLLFIGYIVRRLCTGRSFTDAP